MRIHDCALCVLVGRVRTSAVLAFLLLYSKILMFVLCDAFAFVSVDGERC